MNDRAILREINKLEGVICMHTVHIDDAQREIDKLTLRRQKLIESLHTPAEWRALFHQVRLDNWPW